MSYVLITGASSGIGKELAERFAERKHDLIITARRINILHEIKKDLEDRFNINVVCVQADLSKIEDVKKLTVDADKFDVEILVNNAGIGSFETMWNASIEWDQAMLNLNINALTYLMQHYLTSLVKKDKGSVINISSAGGAIFFPGASIYSSTKWYVSTLTKQTHIELREANSKVTVKCVEPGMVTNDFLGGSTVKVGKEKLFNELKKQFESGSSDRSTASVTSKEVSEFTIKLLESDKVMGRIVGEDRKMWNPEDERKIVKKYLINALNEVSK